MVITSRPPARFDFAPIDTCEEAMFAPGADMLVRALVGDEAHVRVSFRALDHQLDYVQTAEGVSGSIDGQPFALQREAGTLAGTTSGGPIEVTVTPTETGSHVEGHAGAMGFRHDLERRDANRVRIRGKFD